MQRRDFIRGIGAAGGLAALEWPPLVAAAAEGAAPLATDALGVESRQAFRELLDLVGEAQLRMFSAEWGVRTPQEVVDGHRLLLHLVAAATDLYFEADPERPHFAPIVSPTRKFLGDNPDAVYFLAPLRADRSYRIRGNVASAVYTSFTFQAGDENGIAGRIFATVNDRQFDVARDGSYEIQVAPDAGGRNSVRLEPGAVSVTTRHYFENEISAQNDPTLRIPLSIEPVKDPGPPLPPTTPRWRDGSVSRRASCARPRSGCRRVRLRNSPPGPRAFRTSSARPAPPARERATRRPGGRSTTRTAWGLIC